MQFVKPYILTVIEQLEIFLDENYDPTQIDEMDLSLIFNLYEYSAFARDVLRFIERNKSEIQSKSKKELAEAFNIVYAEFTDEYYPDTDVVRSNLEKLKKLVKKI